MARPKKTVPTPPTFEEAYTKLEEIVSTLEEENLPLEEMIARYEEGAALLKDCQIALSKAHERIKKITLQPTDESASSAENNSLEDESEERNEDDIRLF